jgi:tetratricopeptide (TPR) repeat protein
LHETTSDLAAAFTTLERARAVAEGLVRDHTGCANHQSTLVGVWHALGELRSYQGRFGEARTAFEHGFEISERQFQDFPEDRPVVYEFSTISLDLVRVERLMGDRAAALALCRRALGHWEQAFPPAPGSGPVDGVLGKFYFEMATTLVQLNRPEEALRALDRAREQNTPATRPQTESLHEFAEALRAVEEGEHAAVTANWRGRADAAPGDGETVARAAAIFARAAEVVQKDQGLAPAERSRRAEDYAAAAVGYVRMADMLGTWKHAEKRSELKMSPLFTSLRTREDFRQLLAAIEKQ